MKTAYSILAVTLLAIALGSCHLIGTGISVLRLFDTTSAMNIATLNGITVRSGKYYLTFAGAEIDDRAYHATGGAALRWLVVNLTVSDTCRNVLSAGLQRFPLMPHGCPAPPALIPATMDTTWNEPSGGLDR